MSHCILVPGYQAGPLDQDFPVADAGEVGEDDDGGVAVVGGLYDFGPALRPFPTSPRRP